MSVLGVSIAPRRKLRTKQNKQKTRERAQRETAAGYGDEHPNTRRWKTGGGPQQGTGISAPTPEKYGSVRWVALTRLTRPARMTSWMAA